MQPYVYAVGVLVVFRLKLTSAASLLPDPVQIPPQDLSNKMPNEPESPIVDSQIPEENYQGDVTNANIQDLVSSTAFAISTISVKPTSERTTELKEKRRNVVLKAITQILQHKARKADKNNTVKKDKINLHDLHSVAASELVRIALAKNRSKRSNTKVNPRIGEINNGRDIVLEAVSQLIKGEKTRRSFDIVNPPNSKFSKRQQLLWDRLRIKAAEELLLHPMFVPQRATERIYDTLKKDLELASPQPTMEPGLFNEFKRRIEKQFYLDEYERGRGRELISTLKPVVY